MSKINKKKGPKNKDYQRPTLKKYKHTPKVRTRYS